MRETSRGERSKCACSNALVQMRSARSERRGKGEGGRVGRVGGGGGHLLGLRKAASGRLGSAGAVTVSDPVAPPKQWSGSGWAAAAGSGQRAAGAAGAAGGATCRPWVPSHSWIVRSSSPSSASACAGDAPLSPPHTHTHNTHTQHTHSRASVHKPQLGSQHAQCCSAQGGHSAVSVSPRTCRAGRAAHSRARTSARRSARQRPRSWRGTPAQGAGPRRRAVLSPTNGDQGSSGHRNRRQRKGAVGTITDGREGSSGHRSRRQRREALSLGAPAFATHSNLCAGREHVLETSQLQRPRGHLQQQQRKAVRHKL